MINDRGITKIKTINGKEEIELSYDLSWGQEKKIVLIVGKIIGKFPLIKEWILNALNTSEENESKENESEESNEFVSKAFDILPEICEQCPEYITEIASIIIKKDTIWIENNFNLEKIIQVIAPFLSFCLKRITGTSLQAKKELKKRKKKIK